MWMQLASVLLFTVTCISSSVGGEEVFGPLVQTWRYEDDGYSFLSLASLRSDCYGGVILVSRVVAGFREGKEWYIVNAGQCTKRKTTQLRRQLGNKIKECYSKPDCEGVDLVDTYYAPLVAENCSIRNGQHSQTSTVNLFKTASTFHFEVRCTAALESGQLVTSTDLESSGVTEVFRNDFPTTRCDGKLKIEHVATLNLCSKDFGDFRAQMAEKQTLTSRLENCLDDEECQSVFIETTGRTCRNKSKMADHNMGIIWSCLTSDHTTPFKVLTARGENYRSALIAVSTLLVIALIALAIAIFFLIRAKRSHDSGEKEKTTINNNNESNLINRIASRKEETLQKYQHPVRHQLENHRYAAISLTKQPSEDLYEYVDTDVSTTTPPRGANFIDTEGYLIPQP